MQRDWKSGILFSSRTPGVDGTELTAASFERLNQSCSAPPVEASAIKSSLSQLPLQPPVTSSHVLDLSWNEVLLVPLPQPPFCVPEALWMPALVNKVANTWR